MPRAGVSSGLPLPLPALPMVEKNEEPVLLSTRDSEAARVLREEEAAVATANDDGGGGLATDDAVADRGLQRVAEVLRQLLAARRPAAAAVAAVAAVDSHTRGEGPIIARGRRMDEGGERTHVSFVAKGARDP